MPLNADSIFHGMQNFLLVHAGLTSCMNFKCWKINLISELCWYPEKKTAWEKNCTMGAIFHIRIFGSIFHRTINFLQSIGRLEFHWEMRTLWETLKMCNFQIILLSWEKCPWMRALFSMGRRISYNLWGYLNFIEKWEPCECDELSKCLTSKLSCYPGKKALECGLDFPWYAEFSSGPWGHYEFYEIQVLKNRFNFEIVLISWEKKKKKKCWKMDELSWYPEKKTALAMSAIFHRRIFGSIFHRTENFLQSMRRLEFHWEMRTLWVWGTFKMSNFQIILLSWEKCLWMRARFSMVCSFFY